MFYYQHVPKLVGPVRSMRATDIGIVKPAKAVLVASGGAPPTVRRIKAAGITSFTEGATGYERDNSRRAPYNLFMHLTRSWRRRSRPRTPSTSYLPFGVGARTCRRARRPRGLAASFSGGHTTTGSTRGGKYTNQNSYAQSGDQFRPDNVLVLRVHVGDAGYKDPAGNPVPETKFTGTGKAMLFHGGRVVRGTWKKSLDSTITLQHPAGRAAGPGRAHLDRAGPRERRQRHDHEVGLRLGRALVLEALELRSQVGRAGQGSARLGHRAQAGEDVGDRGLDLGARLLGVLGRRHRRTRRPTWRRRTPG